ncbi:hypothetical protein [Kitasatospora sp. McL0602]|uniref:hypothetical protein n=1 Tax=Kitasatospora sp. McL0602 TaxID=3439530 RepID=UPI003F8B1C4D
MNEPSDVDSKSTPTTRLYTGGERPFDPEDLVMVSGRDLTPERLQRAQEQIDKYGAAALERYLP